MLQEVFAHTVVRPMSNGKTKPCLVVAADVNGNDVELVVKFSAGCDGVEGLISEAISALLAADLELPVPEPFLVKFEPNLINTIQNSELRAIAAKSTPIAFGSQLLPQGFSTPPQKIPHRLLVQATEILFFDAMIENPDRRAERPNCLFNSTSYAIFDHELCFVPTLFGAKPWETFGAKFITEGTSQHIFYQELKGTTPDLTRVIHAFQQLSDNRLNEYKNTLPTDWSSGMTRADYAIERIREIRSHLDDALVEITRVLS